jgi:rhomboid family GlyGly-CTERM serine protease
VGRAVSAPLVLGLPAILVQLAPGAAERLEYDRARLAAGEAWRLATCHFAHWTPEHLLWDLGAVAALAVGCAPFGMRRLAAAAGAAMVAIPLAVWIALPSMTRYRGLSGLASALFALLAVAVLREARAGGRAGLALAAAVALGGFAAKLAWELATASPAFVGPGAGFVAVPLAHLVGAACGGCCAPAVKLAPLVQSAREGGKEDSMKLPGLVFLLLAGVLAGCASAGPPVASEEVTEAEAALRSAEAAGAEEQAPELFEEARIALAAARRASGEEARQRLLEARGYAAAAEAQAKAERLKRDAARLRREADDLERRAQEIREEAGRPPVR